jgi:hypothetical protein
MLTVGRSRSKHVLPYSVDAWLTAAGVNRKASFASVMTPVILICGQRINWLLETKSADLRAAIAVDRL